MAMYSAHLAPRVVQSPTPPAPTTLRTLLEARLAEKRRMSLQEAVAVLVPVCADLHARHTRGEKLFVHPSAIAPGHDGMARVQRRLSVAPVHEHDRACLAPEQMATLAPGDECTSVWAVGVMLYEMVTGEHVGPTMKRPREVDPSLPEVLEFVLGNAIVSDRQARPSDLDAMAAALMQMVPQLGPYTGVPHAPPSEPAGIDVRFSIIPTDPPLPAAQGDMDVRFSVIPSIPPMPLVPALPASSPPSLRVAGGTAVRHGHPKKHHQPNQTHRLAALKARLESDPRPRYVVSKDRMDHGPFTAVELLQQLASHSFAGSDVLRDDVEGIQRPIVEWEDFAPFSHHAELVRHKKAEEKAVVHAARADKKRGIFQLLIAAALVTAAAGVLAVWFFSRRGTRHEEVVVVNDRTDSVDVAGDIKGAKHHPHGGTGGGGGGSYSSGLSYEAILNGAGDSVFMGRATGGTNVPDLTNGQLAAPLRYASFLGSCGAPGDMKVTVRVAVRMGRAVGATITTNPPNGAVAACIDRVVRNLSWAQSPKTDFVTVNY